MQYQVASIKTTRDNLAEIVEKVALKKEIFLITKFNKPKALIVPVDVLTEPMEADKKTQVLEKTFGAWSKKKCSR